MFLKQQVVWLSLEELSQQPNLDYLLNLLTLPVAQIQALPLEQLEALGTWLAANS